MAIINPKIASSTMDVAVRIALCKKKADEPNLTQSDLLKWLQDVYNIKVTQSTISNTLKKSRELLDKDIGRPCPTMDYRIRIALCKKKAEEPNLTQHDLLKWLHEVYNIKVTQDAKAFEFSNGWLQSFKKRHGIKLFRKHKERGSVDMVQLETELPRIREVLDQYKWDDIYNMDQTGLFYRMQADSFLATKQLEGRKAIKERITVVPCCNGDGSARLPLWVIGKFSSPHCLNNVNLENLGCIYRANTKASMTVALFIEWLKWFDSRMHGRNVLLILDTSSTLVPLRDIPQLENTQVFYLPANTTSKIQPLDVGIIKSLKACYRRRFNQKLLRALEIGVDLTTVRPINILEGIGMLVEAWEKDVKHSILVNCFHYCKIKSMSLQVDVTEEMLEDAEVMSELMEQIHQLPYSSPMDIKDFINYPRESDVAYFPTELEIVQAIGSHNGEIESQKAPSSEDQEDDSEELPELKPSEVTNMLSLCEGFFLQQMENQQQNIKMIRELIFNVQHRK
ncbi:ARS-binding protein 1-like isoform X2 [Telopea speciosissima]|uniref:ARS-binding protein 1-like isoform X2 n=1 Tax=Telopea speciosissima TaxID=54955 RepID=UPI001CC34C78|nr:ARS-binding protein 1-like isoform X2 [Telopea speciosissima]